MANIANHNMDWEERIKCQNIAEEQFEMDYNYRNRGNGSWCYKYGIDNEKAHGKDLRGVKSLILNTPDFLCWDNTERHFYFVEVKHCGYNLNLKKVHFDNYKKWNKCHQVKLWVLHNDSIAYLSVERIDQLIVDNNYDTGKYPDCVKEYWIIPFKDLLV